MISILTKSFTSSVYDIFFLVLIVFLCVSFLMWIALPIVLFSMRNELKKLNQTLKDYISKIDNEHLIK
jgi:ABC-type Na+ efflux pump permease subunit